MRTPLGLALLVLIAGLSLRPSAHDPISSKYTYNDDVYPIVRRECGSCHVTGGVAPMSLLTYDDAYPWARSIKEEVMFLHMPPWHVEEGFGPVKRPRLLSAREMDILIDWAGGGTPEGDPGTRPAPAQVAREWTLGPPDLVLAMPEEAVLDEATSELVRSFTISTGITADRWLRAVDLRPGTPAIVRDATIVLNEGPDAVTARWLPGEPASLAGADAGVRLRARAPVTLRIHYRKTWTSEGFRLTDRSEVGLYFTDRPALQLRSIVLGRQPAGRGTAGRGDAGHAARGPDDPSFSHLVDRPLRAIAILPEAAPVGSLVQVEALLPDGTRQPILRLRHDRPHWERRYWFEHPIELPTGTRIDVTLRPLASDPAPAPPQESPAGPVKIWLDVLEGRA
jgi:hypothetical protein